MWAASHALIGLFIAAIGVQFETVELADSFGGALWLLVVCYVHGRDGFTSGTDGIKARHG